MAIDRTGASAESERLHTLAHELISRLRAADQSKKLPAELTPSTLHELAPGLYQQFLEILPKKPGEEKNRDWTLFYELLLAEYPDGAARWDTPEHKRAKALERHAAALVKELRTRNWSGSLNPAVIIGFYGNYGRLLENLSPVSGARGGQRDWSPIVERLQEFAPLWDDPEKKRAERIAALVGQLVAWLKEQNPAKVSPGVIKRENKTLFNQLVGVVSRGGKYDWDVITEHPDFPEEWRTRWQNKRSGKFLPADIAKVRMALAEKQPVHFGPTWLESQLGRALAERLERRLPRAGGIVDWRPLVEAIDAGEPTEANWTSRWKVENSGQRAHRAEDTLSRCRANLRTTAEIKTTEEAALRDESLTTLLGLAEAGSAESENTLLDFLKAEVRAWAQRELALAAYQEDTEILKRVFEQATKKLKPEKGDEHSANNLMTLFRAQLRLISNTGHGREGTLF